MTSSERPSTEPFLKREASPAVLRGRAFWKCSGSLKRLELKAWRIPATLSRGIPGHALRAFPGSFRTPNCESLAQNSPSFLFPCGTALSKHSSSSFLLAVVVGPQYGWEFPDAILKKSQSLEFLVSVRLEVTKSGEHRLLDVHGKNCSGQCQAPGDSVCQMGALVQDLDSKI